MVNDADSKAAAKLMGGGLARWHGLTFSRPVIWGLVALGGTCLGMALIVVSMLKVWRVTPEGFAPEVRVSWLDMIQARMLAKSAREHMNAGRWKEASLSWRSAVANNPVDIRWMRGWLEAAASDDRILEQGNVALRHAAWLLRLSGTNVADVDLVVRLLGRYEMDENLMQLAAPRALQMGVVAAGQVLRGWFDASNPAAFEELWNQRRADFEADPELALYHEAWKALWGPPAGAREARDRLWEAQSDRRLRKTALRLSSKVAASRGDVVEHARLLRLLGEDRWATTKDHVEHWRLLAATGQIQEARRLASEGSIVPKGAEETVLMAETLQILGLHEAALGLIERRAPDGRGDARRLLLHARCLESLERWQDLARLARTLRSDSLVSLRLEGCSFALEAIASRRMGLMDNARIAASRAARAGHSDTPLTLPVAAALVESGFPAEGLAMLKSMERAARGMLTYWGIRVVAATLAGDGPELLGSSAKALEMAPGNPRTTHNRASALIMTRTEPAEAVRLTFENLSSGPDNPDFQISHAMALIMNQRSDEASRVLASIDEARLTPVHLANYHLAWLDLALAQGDHARVREHLRKLDRSRLVPLQEGRLARELAAAKISGP